MSGGLIQIVAVGAQDMFLTGAPKITFFKVAYRRHTNFAIESMEQFFSGAIDFGKQGTVDVSRNGDLITQVLLRVVLPEVEYKGDFRDAHHAQFAWVRHVGHALVDETSLQVGGTNIDTQYGDWLRIWQELSQQSGQARSLAKMLGDVPELTTISTLDDENPDSRVLKKSYPLYIPLQFFFCRNNGLALPLIALQYHQVKISVKLRPVCQLAVYSEACKATVNDLRLDQASLFINYVYLDTDERKMFAQKSHEYLIEQIQHTDESITGNSAKCKLNFNHPVKALYWVTKLGNYLGGKFMAYDPYDWELARENAAKMLLLSSFDLDTDGMLNIGVNPNGIYQPVNPINPSLESRFVFDDTRVAEHFSKGVEINVLNRSVPLMSLDGKPGRGDVRDKIDGIVRIYRTSDDNPSFYPMVERITRNDLTIADLSIPVSRYVADNRNDFVKNHDVTVWQHHNYGLLIDGSRNPVNTVELQLNGQARQSKRGAEWYDTVTPYLHHSNSPVDGLNVLSFAINPEEHQPSGTCNFSRIDSPQLSLTFGAPCAQQHQLLQSLILDNARNQVHVYAPNYNIFRLVSGMGGLAYAS